MVSEFAAGATVKPGLFGAAMLVMALFVLSQMPARAEADSKTGATADAAASVGKAVAERAKAAGITQVVFDRGGFLFHGRVKALADAAREGGLEF